MGKKEQLYHELKIVGIFLNIKKSKKGHALLKNTVKLKKLSFAYNSQTSWDIAKIPTDKVFQVLSFNQ